MAKANQRQRNWCFTVFDVSSAKRDHLLAMDCKYVVFQLELAPGTGKPHFQGYLELKSGKTRSAVRTMIGGGPHLEKRHGTAEEADNYCRKDASRAPGMDPLGLLVD